MRNQTKKLLSFVAAATMLTSTLALSACGDYKLDDALSLPGTEATVNSNGGFAVEKDGYVYFINGAEDYTAGNKFGDVVKGSLMRIAKSDLSAGNYNKADVVVPMLIGSQNFETGIYIYGDYVYYATPTTDKNLQGVVENSWIDFKRAKLDGSDTMAGYYFRLSSNSANFRFVEVDSTVYCLYEENSMLKSYNTATKETTVLAKGAGTFYFNEKEPTDPYVYYTMGVTNDIDSNKSSTAAYNQIYRVRADATATVNAKEASYTVTGGRTYDFDKAYLEEVNEEAKKTAKEDGTDYEATYVFDDYTTYPYVNLGTLVIDGIGSNYTAAVSGSAKIPYNNATETNQELQGYTYTITRYENGGVYYTRKDNAKLYYYNADADTTATAKEVKANETADIVALNTTKASATALFDIVDGAHQYLYLSGSKVYRATAAVDGDVAEEIEILSGASGKTLWKTEGDYLYYYASGTTASGSSTSGYQLSRVKYTGTEDNYHVLINGNEEFKPVTLTYVDFASSWYMPEIFGDILLYANAQSVGNTSYNYIYATKLGTAEEIKANNEKYEAVYTYFNDELTIDVKNAATYLFRTYGTEMEQQFFDDWAEVQEEYKAANDKEISWIEELEEAKTTLVNEKGVESDFINMIGAVKEDDADAMRESWKSYLPYPTEEDEEGGLPWWAITLIVVGSVIVVAAGVTVPLMILHQKKLKKAEEEATVNAYKHTKIDTTDDKSIDVYADEKVEETPVEETPVEEVPVEEVSTEEATVEETSVEEAPAEEVKDENE